MLANFKLHGTSIEGISLQAIAGHHKPHHWIEAMPEIPQQFFIYNMTTKQATSSAPTAELIEHIYNWYTSGEQWFPKRGPDQVIVEFPTAMGITLHNFHTLPMGVIYNGIAAYSKRKASA